MARRKILLEQGGHPSKSRRDKGQKKPLQRFSLRLRIADVTILIILWFIFVGTISGSESIAAVIGALLVARLAEFVRTTGFARFYPRLHWIAYLRNLPVETLAGCGILLSVLTTRLFKGRQEPGFFKTVPFRSAATGARSAARRASAIIAATIVPNSCVIDIDPSHDFLLVHQIRAAKVPSFIYMVRER